MSATTRTIFLGFSALAASLPLAAQTAATAQPAPAAPAYQSAFEGYRPFKAGDVQDWRKSNDTARDIGGWRAYAREIQGGSKQGGAQGHEGHGAPAAPPAAPSATAAPTAQSAPPAAATRSTSPSPSAPAADPHQGHRQ